ncbi:MAG: phosphoribosylanthranilate isomerase [Ignavibacteriales bacterium]|nr:phosphoribosylanthranilate isomerase [Ignavibacteriota bacterium]MCB9249833.1 phosphoribosylanthranilate isomerase [Ignavibacteriales bacterium]
MLDIKIKICCISNLEEAKLAITYGATAIGLVSAMPSGPGVITEEQIAEIANSVPEHIETFLLTSKQNVKSIIAQLRKCKTNTVQIVDKLIDGTYAQIKSELPNVKIVQVLHVQDEKSILEAIEINRKVDAILLDSGNQNLGVKILGGTGKTHNWEISKKIVEAINVPVYLAGGLFSGNVVEAIKTVKPFGVDLCSGVRTNNKLDKYKLQDFFNAIKSI